MEKATGNTNAPLTSFTLLPLSAIEPLLSNRGALYEGDVFSVLYKSPFVVRSFEFAIADGAIDCTSSFPPGTSFADRFWDIDQRLRVEPTMTRSKLLLFDVKSKISRYAGEQIYNSTTNQRHQVAFYIGICAADPSFIELIPNFYQNPFSTSSPQDDREVAVNASRISRLPPSTYKLDPCNAPYRMPLTLLPKAIEAVRRCAQGKSQYINPWTLVSFPAWKPLTTESSQPLKPSEDSEHFTAYKAVMEIYRLVRVESTQGLVPMSLDFVGLQPRLADFKLVTTFAGYQSFIQHKIDGRDRALLSTWIGLPYHHLLLSVDLDRLYELCLSCLVT